MRIPNITFITALLYVMDNGCEWCPQPRRFDNWLTVYARFRHWSQSGVLERPFAALREQVVNGKEVVYFGLGSTGAQRKNGPQSIGKLRGAWNTKIDMVSASDHQTMIFRLSDGKVHDAPEGRALLESWNEPVATRPWRWIAPPTRATRPAASWRTWG